MNCIKNNNCKIKNTIKQCVIKSKTNRGTAGITFLAAVFVVIIVLIICKWNVFSEAAQVLATLIGIVLAFISILLSYKGLRNTQDLKESLAQQELNTVTKLVMVINEFKMLINFSENINGKMEDCAGIYWSNIWGLSSINNKIKAEYPQYINSSLFFSESFQFPFINQFVSNPSTPSSIVEQLVKLDRKFFEENSELMEGNCVAVNDLNTIDTRYRHSGLSCPDWQSFVNQSILLRNSIENWYMENVINSNPNLPSLFEEIIPKAFGK